MRKSSNIARPNLKHKTTPIIQMKEYLHTVKLLPSYSQTLSVSFHSMEKNLPFPVTHTVLTVLTQLKSIPFDILYPKGSTVPRMRYQAGLYYEMQSRGYTDIIITNSCSAMHLKIVKLPMTSCTLRQQSDTT